MSDIQSKSAESLNADLAGAREKLREFRFEGAGSRKRNVREGRETRKQIARILTEISARAIAEKSKNA